MPFLIAWAVAFAVRPLSHRISKKLHLPKRAVSAALALLFALVFLALLLLVIYLIVRQAWGLVSGIAEDGRFEELIEQIMPSGGTLDRLLGTLGDTLGESLYDLVASVAASLASTISVWVGAVPRVFLFVIITVVASVYFALDLDGINAAVRSLFSDNFASKLVRFKDGFISFTVRYARSYFFLMLISFCVMLIGLSVLGVKYALLLSLIIAILDVLPVIGVGTVLLLWSIFCFISGSAGLGVGLIVLLCLHEVIRQIAEPKILGKSLGIHPLVTLIIIYVGFTLFGVAGLLLVPVVSVLLDVILEKNNTAKVGEHLTDGKTDNG